ncbi:thiamine biosynthesis protein ThiF [Sulfurimonas sp.]
MTHGFDVTSPLVCEGIIGDGCGGGRFFLVEDETLVAYDPQTQMKIFLLDGIKNAKVVKKKTCLLTIECENEVIRFDLSALKRV